MPITKERHASLTWRRPGNYFHAASDAVVAIVAQEVPRALPAMALAFMESDGKYILVALQGFKQGHNRFVSSDGRWLGDYIPAVYRTYPFKLARNQDGADILCINEAEAQVNDDGSKEPFFNADGTPAPAVADALKMLAEIENDRKRTLNSCEVLGKHGLLEPWPLKVQDGDKVIEPNGLFRIAEAKLYGLTPEILAEVRNSGGLMLAFAQLFSMQQLQKLIKPAAQSTTAPAQSSGPALTEDNGIISFANL